MSAEKYAQWIVENQDKQGTPEFETVAQAYQAAKEQSQPTLRQKVMASTPMRVVQGMRDPIDAAAQMLPRGLEFVTSAGGLAENPVSQFFGSEARRVDEGIQQAEQEYNQARQATGQDGMDLARLGGNIVSPANLAIASRLPMAATTGGRIMTGAAAGAVGGALQPVVNEEGGSFAATKAGQTLLGGASGGIATPIFGKLTDFASQQAAKFLNKPNFRNELSLSAVQSQDDALQLAQYAAEKSGVNWSQADDQTKRELVDFAKKAMTENPGVDLKSAFRVADFNAMKMPYTLGQVTRDPLQFAAEKNLQQVAGVGDPVRERVMGQNAQLQKIMSGFGGKASEQQTAGSMIIDSLRNFDESLSNKISAQYKIARESAGKDADVPLQGLAQDFAEVLNNFGDKVPSGVRNNFASYGIGPIDKGMTQRKIFTVEEADKLLKVINANQSNDPATNSALSALRGAVKKAVTQDAGADDVFAPARKLAADRFALQEAIPALDAAASGTVNPDTFVQNFILSQTASTPKVKALADLLRSQDETAFDEAKTQIGAYLQRQAFGENVAGDKALAPERFSKALRTIGTEKLRAFYSPDEIKQLQRVARIGAYMESPPYASRPNTSGNFGAITGLASRIPGMPVSAAIVGALRNSVGNQLAVNKALTGKPTAQLTPEQARYAAQLLGIGGMASGGAVAQELK